MLVLQRLGSSVWSPFLVGLCDAGFDAFPQNVALELREDGEHPGQRTAARWSRSRSCLRRHCSLPPSRTSLTPLGVACVSAGRAAPSAFQPTAAQLTLHVRGIKPPFWEHLRHEQTR